MKRRAPQADTSVTLGLLAAWALHDTEELVTVPRWVRTRVPELRKRYPQVPEGVWRQLEAVDGREFATAVAAMAVVVGVAAVDGYRTGGRSAVYQTALNGFGLHGVVHLAQAAAARGYTPGSVTSPLVVIPFTLWARGRLRRAGVLRPARPRDVVQALGFAGVAAVGTHALARRVLSSR
ncbi:HXXEE domain-containing protein [Streptomyces actinomycinicus]|uniref:HXXEE domain-containing protein n=1 Tax=Streptomyces actinomycinicus TaxID=1695166 RepID=A0A937JNI5_9ACTN|nr:HXXEE domain-containing protein [Streptomyces actinomycinicus]MBL1084625.1 HXXEE domain-containing protein [Streptomyces actinomycinicus]